MVAKVEATVEEGRAEVGTAVVREAAREISQTTRTMQRKVARWKSMGMQNMPP